MIYQEKSATTATAIMYNYDRKWYIYIYINWLIMNVWLYVWMYVCMHVSIISVV